MWNSWSTRSPIGVDVGLRYFNALQLHRKQGVWRVAAVASVPRTGSGPIPAAEELAQLVGVLERQGFVGRRVVLAAPESMVFAGQLELPPRGSGAPLNQIAQMELARMHKRQPDSFKMDSWDLPATKRGSDGTHVMVAGCNHADAEALLDRVESVGFDVVALDTAGWALARACRPLFDGGTQIAGILDLGWSSARLVVLYQGVIIYERLVKEGGMGSLHAALVERTGQDPEVVAHLIEASSIAGSRDTDPIATPEMAGSIESHVDVLVKLITDSFSYASHRYREATTRRLVVVGGGGAVEGMSRRLGEAVEFEVVTTSLARLVELAAAAQADQDHTAFITALGLSQHGRGAAA